MFAARKRRIHELTKLIRGFLKVGPNVDMIDVVQKLGGTIAYETLDEKISGKIEKISSEKSHYFFRITINEAEKDYKERVKFTLAHELGHLFLHMGYLIDEKKWQETELYSDSAYYRFGYSEEEFEANEFAANFLMPEREFEDFIEKQRAEKGKADVETVAKYFGVSKSAVTTRAKWLGYLNW